LLVAHHELVHREDARLQFLAGVQVEAVHVLTYGVHAPVSAEYPVRVDHRHEEEHEALDDRAVLGVRQVSEHAVHHVAGRHFARVHPRAD